MTLNRQLTALLRLQYQMDTKISSRENDCRLGESAILPIELRYGTLTALLLVAGTSPQPRHALSASRIAAHSAASNYRY